MNDGPVLVVDDDSDDRDFLNAAWEKLPFANQLIFMSTGNEVLDYLKSDKQAPFLICAM